MALYLILVALLLAVFSNAYGQTDLSALAANAKQEKQVVWYTTTSAGDNQAGKRDDMNGARARFDSLEFAFAIQRDARAIEQCLVRARPECVADCHQQAGEDKTHDPISEPAADHAGNLDQRAEYQTSTISELVSKPAGGDLQRHQEEVAGSHRCSDQRRRHLFLLYPPQEVETVHDAFDGGDLVWKVEREVSTVTAASIGRHEY